MLKIIVTPKVCMAANHKLTLFVTPQNLYRSIELILVFYVHKMSAQLLLLASDARYKYSSLS